MTKIIDRLTADSKYAWKCAFSQKDVHRAGCAITFGEHERDELGWMHVVENMHI